MWDLFGAAWWIATELLLGDTITTSFLLSGKPNFKAWSWQDLWIICKIVVPCFGIKTLKNPPSLIRRLASGITLQVGVWELTWYMYIYIYIYTYIMSGSSGRCGRSSGHCGRSSDRYGRSWQAYNIFLSLYIYIYICIYTHIHTYVCIYIYIYINIHINKKIYIYIL